MLIMDEDIDMSADNVGGLVEIREIRN